MLQKRQQLENNTRNEKKKNIKITSNQQYVTVFNSILNTVEKKKEFRGQFKDSLGELMNHDQMKNIQNQQEAVLLIENRRDSSQGRTDENRNKT